jgi:hypothetical protein
MSYDYRAKKTVIAIASELPVGAAANVIGHLGLSVGNRLDHTDMGHSPMADASGVMHMGISKYPVIVVTAKAARLRKLLVEARAVTDIYIADFPEQMLSTGHDDELVQRLGKLPEVDLKYLGVALHGEAKAIQPLTGKFSLWGSHIA